LKHRKNINTRVDKSQIEYSGGGKAVTGLFGDKKLLNLDKRLLVQACSPKKFGRLGGFGGDIVEDYVSSGHRNCTRRRPQAILNFLPTEVAWNGRTEGKEGKEPVLVLHALTFFRFMFFQLFLFQSIRKIGGCTYVGGSVQGLHAYPV
jgi:hypothetical protein